MVVVGIEESSCEDEGEDSLLVVFDSTRVAGGTTLGGLDELKKRPPGGFENKE